jgi:glucosamine 6-phosphate synthetase-like amidotransferase/phosphosugar isomerase protein
MVVAKSAEKLQLETDMKKKITEMEDTFEQLKQSLSENETVKELFNKFEDKWDIVKLKLDKYKDMK